MLVRMYAIYDTKAAAYLQPFFCANNAIAFRNIERACKNPQSPFAEFPADFNLFCLASFEDVDGVLTPFEYRENLGNLLQFQAINDSASQPQAVQLPLGK